MSNKNNINPEKSIKKGKFSSKFTFVLILFLLCSFILLGYARFIEPYTVKTSSLSIKAPVTRPVKVVLFADTHFSSWYTCKDFDKSVKIINDSNPDIIIFAGDLIDDFNNFKQENGNTVENITKAFSSLNATYGKFAVYGNHDYGGGAEKEFAKIMNESNFKILKNENLFIPELNINISGLDDTIWCKKDDTFLASLDGSKFNLVISHEPDAIDSFDKSWHVDLVTAGHTHGGQVNIPFLSELILPHFGKKYLKGSFSINNNRDGQLYVTSGLGMTKLPLRFRATPEVSFIYLKQHKNQ